MEVLVSTNPEDGEVTSNLNDGNQVFQIGNPNNSSEEGSVVILRSNPMILPMVCGLCGNQYAAARGEVLCISNLY